MRILMLSWEYPPRIVGGISRVVHDLAQELGAKNNEVHIVTCWEEGSPVLERDRNVIVHRVHTYNLNANNFIDWVLQLNFAFLEYASRLIKETGHPDIIHAHDWVVAFSARALKNTYSIPLIATIHATESGRNWGIHNETQRYIHSVEWWLTYEAWKVIVNSEYMKKEVLSLFNLPENKLRLIPNGVDLHKFDGCIKDHVFRRNYAMDTEKIVFFVGRLVNEKGAQILIEAAPKILHYYNGVKFVIAGKGPQMEYLKYKCDELKISNKVYLTGYIDDKDLNLLYKCSDIAVFPSLYEPFGIVALEAMVADLPVVVSEAGGLGELVEHGVDGMKSYAGNANSLADCILEILYNPDKSEDIKSKALEKVSKNYNWNLISDNLVAVYKEVVEECRRSNWKMPGIMDSLN